MRATSAIATTRAPHELAQRVTDIANRLGAVERSFGEGGDVIWSFTDLAALTAEWPDAPVGATALLLDCYQLMLKVGGGWSPTVQCGTSAVTTSSTGAATITFPTPFVAPPIIVCTDGDSSNGGVRIIGIVRANTLATSFRFVAFGHDGALWASKVIRVDYIAELRP